LSPKSFIGPTDLVTSEVMPAVAALKNEPDVESANLGFAGYSYGGYAALTLLGRTDTFKAFSAEVPLANLSVNLSANPETRLLDCAPSYGMVGFTELEAPNGFLRLGGAAYLRRDRMVTDSPLFYLGSATTPTLLFSAELDNYASNAEQVYMMLLRKQVPARLVSYWGEEHNIESPGNVRNMVEHQNAWFTKYLVR